MAWIEEGCTDVKADLPDWIGVIVWDGATAVKVDLLGAVTVLKDDWLDTLTVLINDWSEVVTVLDDDRLFVSVLAESSDCNFTLVLSGSKSFLLFTGEFLSLSTSESIKIKKHIYMKNLSWQLLKILTLLFILYTYINSTVVPFFDKNKWIWEKNLSAWKSIKKNCEIIFWKIQNTLFVLIIQSCLFHVK